MMLFPKALFLVTNFPKIGKNSIFLLNFHQNSQNFPKICGFSPNHEKLTRGLLNLLKNMQKTMHFKKFCENFRKFSGP